MDLDQIAREGKLSRRQFLRTAAILGSGILILPYCGKEDIIGPKEEENQDEEENTLDKTVKLHTYLDDLTGKHGVSNWLILLTYQRNYSGKGGSPTQRTNQDGFTKFAIPWNADDVSVRFAMAIKETPDGKDWNDDNFPSYLDGWSHEWTLNAGAVKYVFVSIQEPHMKYSLVSPP